MNSMNSRERIIEVLNNGQPDKVPIFELLIDEASVIKLAKLLIDNSIKIEDIKTRFGEESLDSIDLYCSIVKKLNMDSATAYISADLEIMDNNIGIDRFGTKYHLSSHGQPLPFEGPVNNLKDTEGFNMAASLKMQDFERLKYVTDKLIREKAVFLIIADPFKLS